MYSESMAPSASPCQFGPEELVVNFHDACMYGRDLCLLDSPCAWLNDACLHFAMTELQVNHDHAANDPRTATIPTTTTTTTTTLFMDPAVISFLMHQCYDQEDFEDFRRGCRGFDHIQRWVIPINDTLTAEDWAVPGTGSHWSLLVVHVIPHITPNTTTTTTINVAYHFDSVRCSGNHRVAQAVLEKLIMAIGDTVEAMDGSKKHVPKVISCESPQQENGYDCGVMVIGLAQAIADVPFPSQPLPTQAAYEDQLQKHITKGAPFCRNLRLDLARRIRHLATGELGQDTN